MGIICMVYATVALLSVKYSLNMCEPEPLLQKMKFRGLHHRVTPRARLRMSLRVLAHIQKKKLQNKVSIVCDLLSAVPCIAFQLSKFQKRGIVKTLIYTASLI